MIQLFRLASHLTALLVLSGFSQRLWHNLGFLRWAGEFRSLPDHPPRVSVLVPARNEARTIRACIDSLAAQDFPDLEIIALDDQSTDHTGAILDDLKAHHPNLTVLRGSENPPLGWNGKSYACQRLADVASGEWLLFTDADTLHTPASIAQGIAQAHGLGVDLLSVFPRQITESWSERVVVSFIMDFLPLVAVDLTALWRGHTARGAANGQYMLVRADAYRAAGGHTAIAGALVDDFALMNQLRANGRRVALVDGTAMLSCRMYQNGGEVWGGFSKNIWLALEMSSDQKRPWWWGLAFAWGYACLFVLPFSWLALPASKRWVWIEISWLAVLRALVNWRFGRSVAEIPTTPLAAWSVMAFGLNAVLRRRQGKPVRWKGRDYSVSD